MASFWSVVAVLIVLMASQIHAQLSSISAAPSFLPDAPLSSLPPGSSNLSPDIEPEFPTPGTMAPSPSESSMPTIPSSPSPPNPDDMPAPGPELASSPSAALPASSSIALSSPGLVHLAVCIIGLLAFCSFQFSGM